VLPIVHAALYDFPKYYDLVFGSDWQAEYRFLLQAFERFGSRRVRRIFEPACGTGRLLIKLAEAGYEVAGNDLNPKAVAFCNARFARRGRPPPAQVGDMARFGVRRRFDAAFNLINSFRHLPSEQAAENHLRCMARAVHPGGIYLLGLHLTPQGRPTVTSESWSARRGNLAVNSRLWTVSVDRRRRRELVGMTFDVYTPTRQFRIVDTTVFRTYTARQMHTLLRRVAAWDVVATYDFAYDIRRPIVVDGRTEDVVYVLRRR
jgi:SAM-dependent methyltransferase